MLAETEKNDKLCFYSLSEETLVELDLPEIRNKMCWGSPFGWLITCGLDIEIQLFHPLSRATLPLPSLHSFTRRHENRDPDDSDDQDEDSFEYMPFCKYFVDKFILSSSPALNHSNCIVMAIFTSNRLLAFAKPGDKAWTPIENIRLVTDVIYFKGNFYACEKTGEVFVCEDLDGSYPNAVKFAPASPAPVPDNKYLFDLGGNLCMASGGLVEYEEGDDVSEEDEEEEEEEDGLESKGEGEDDVDDEKLRYSSFDFMVFMLDMDTKTWQKIYSLGDSSLFVGYCCTFVILAADYPGCKPNCIYFTDDNETWVHDSTMGRGIDMGIYDCRNLELDINDDETDYFKMVERFPKSKDVPPLVPSSLSRPLWIIPLLVH